MSKVFPHKLKYLRPGFTAIGLSILVLGFAGSPMVNASNYQSEINNLSNQNAQIQATQNGLQVQAANYQQSINQYQAQIAGIQNSIAINQAKLNQDQQQISSDNAKIAQNKGYLANDLKTMYVQGQMSTLEQLATSQDLSVFINKQEDDIKLQDQLNGLLTSINNLEAQTQQNKNQEVVLLKIENSQQAQITADQNQVNTLLAMNQQQQAAYNAQLASNNSQIAILQAEQIAANRLLVGTGVVDASGSCGGGYPVTANGPNGNWGCAYPLDNTIDDFGMYNRECVSYTAWMVYKTYGYMVNWGSLGVGNANQWPADAQADGIPTGTTPQVNSVAIYMGGPTDPFGHAMWVKSVNSNGTITVDQYNLYYDGNFYETTIPSAGLTYIYFGS